MQFQMSSFPHFRDGEAKRHSIHGCGYYRSALILGVFLGYYLSPNLVSQGNFHGYTEHMKFQLRGWLASFTY